MYRKYAKTLGELLRAVPGNAAVFYPAYHVMDEIIKELPHAGRDVLVERKEMGKHERKVLYDRLAGGSGKVLMGVQAGSFSEGVDYPEGMLSAVFVVGLPLERPNLETQALIDYYDFRFERGWDFGYIYPAVNRALQAAGRCIRSETDRGAIILMDERFRWANYAKCFPQDYDFIVTETPEKYIKKFFG
jgi:DNA excision repair protein ERCC-2